MQRTLYAYPGTGIASHIIQHSALTISGLYLSRPSLLQVLHGSQRVQTAEGDWLVREGEMLALDGGQMIDVHMDLDERGRYASRTLSWDETLLAAFDREAPPALMPHAATPIAAPHRHFTLTLENLFDALAQEPPLPTAIVHHRMREPLLWLAEHGVRLADRRAQTLTQQVRDLLMSDIAHPWSAAEVAERLEMNEVMLRRRLAAEEGALRNLITDTRMTHALRLLQSTDAAIATIAQQVGYESGSRFAGRFRSRFGFLPTAIRGHHRPTPCPDTAA
ncbi:AraC family transcriptional regulator [Nissabacter sp. SGAir0207]|uniref:helix-turn-helix transcriptional regulator n=1 Tax=Nissabacter sp. SGAir0207 TaxID=2126321 RepID=UPI0010CD59D1|nr:AraC family transcriptional regulator [Nissabacter sp. SGAir0207]QCR35842.1 AraC family transcriptional regulator [Nissabacter sp. SGAir0207]